MPLLAPVMRTVLPMIRVALKTDMLEEFRREPE